LPDIAGEVPMSSPSVSVESRPSVGLFRRLLPTFVVAAGVIALLAAWGAPGRMSDAVRLPLIGGVLAIFTFLLLRTLRPLGAGRKIASFGVLWLIGLPMLVWRLSSMDGNFVPIIVARNWVQDVFLGGSADAILERHRLEQGKADVVADLTIRPGDWPAYRGANRDGVATGPKLARDWSKSSPKEIWRQPVGGGYASFAIANGFLVTIEQRRDREVVVCYEAATGKEVWATGWDTRFEETAGGPGPRATPTIADGDVFALGAKGRLVCLDGKDGKEKWSIPTLDGNANITWAMSGSPLVVDKLVIVNPGAQTEQASGRAVRAYDRTSGQEVWAVGNHKAGYASPQVATLGGTKQILIFDADGLGGYDLSKGTELWRLRWPTFQGINVAQPNVIDDHTVFISSDYSGEAVGGALLRITQTDGKWSAAEVWRTKNTVMRCKFNSPVRRTQPDGDFVYGLNDPGKLECVDLKTGKLVWKDDRREHRGDAFGQGQILLQDDLILALTEFGELVLVEATPTAFRELGRIDALRKGPKTWNPPAIAHGKIYVRNEEEMACYDLTER
jgi:outer membrane protein assembly factor BamB